MSQFWAHLGDTGIPAAGPEQVSEAPREVSGLRLGLPGEGRTSQHLRDSHRFLRDTSGNALDPFSYHRATERHTAGAVQNSRFNSRMRNRPVRASLRGPRWPEAC